MLTGLGVLGAIPIVFMEVGPDPIGAVSTVIQTGLQAAAAVLLLLPPVHEWFKNKEPAGKR